MYEDIQKIVSDTKYIVESACDLYDYMNPSEAEIAAKKAQHDKNVRELAYSKAFRSMNKCLLGNTESLRDEQGIPINCQSVCKLFAQIAGDENLKREIDAFIACTK